MTTAAEYRAYARECIQTAREATTDEIRTNLLDLAKLWMTSAAEKMDGGHMNRHYKKDISAFAESMQTDRRYLASLEKSCKEASGLVKKSRALIAQSRTLLDDVNEGSR